MASCTVTFLLVLTFSNVPVGVTNPDQLGAHGFEPFVVGTRKTYGAF